MDQIDIRVAGMSCNHCRSSVEKALQGLPGVQEVLVSLEDGRARVSGLQLERTTILKAVEECGFEAAIELIYDDDGLLRIQALGDQPPRILPGAEPER